MFRIYLHKFHTPGGKQVFVPTELTRQRGKKLIGWITKRWKVPFYYYHLKAGGHIKALSVHLDDSFFAKTDLMRFFDHITRTKVARALNYIGFSNREAFNYAAESTVQKTAGCGGYSLPFGFPQSPILASLVLHHSALGKCFEDLQIQGVNVSLYMDDIIISSRAQDTLISALKRITNSAQQAGFALNPEKSAGPSTAIVAFNITLSNKLMQITSDRMDKFLVDYGIGSKFTRSGIEAYIQAVNVSQLSSIFPDDGKHVT